MKMKERVEWTQSLLDLVKEGGAWYIPRARTFYTVNHQDKTVIRNGPGDEAVEEVLKQMNWKVKGN